VKRLCFIKSFIQIVDDYSGMLLPGLQQHRLCSLEWQDDCEGWGREDMECSGHCIYFKIVLMYLHGWGTAENTKSVISDLWNEIGTRTFWVINTSANQITANLWGRRYHGWDSKPAPLAYKSVPLSPYLVPATKRSFLSDKSIFIKRNRDFNLFSSRFQAGHPVILTEQRVLIREGNDFVVVCTYQGCTSVDHFVVHNMQSIMYTSERHVIASLRRMQLRRLRWFVCL
jgi:hypothetical protein